MDWRNPASPGNYLHRNVITGVRNQLYCCAPLVRPPLIHEMALMSRVDGISDSLHVTITRTRHHETLAQIAPKAILLPGPHLIRALMQHFALLTITPCSCV